jgi:tRNA pseudouridine38-40 synthase
VEKEVRVALKLAYDGTAFFGFQRQPAGRTVEGDLVNALMKVGAISSHKGCGYRSSSRTDRGVSALGNIVSFRTQFDPAAICSAVNSKMEDVWVYSAVQVPDEFHPRAARQRWYRYHLAKADQDLKVMKEVAARFVGVHDFSSYSKSDGRNPMRKLDSIDIRQDGMFYAIDFRAESFLWNMVRRMVWMMDEGGSGRMALDCIGPEPGRMPKRMGLAPPEYLVLMDIDCGIDFPVNGRVAIGLERAVAKRLRRGAMRLSFDRLLLEAVSRPGEA